MAKPSRVARTSATHKDKPCPRACRYKLAAAIRVRSLGMIVLASLLSGILPAAAGATSRSRWSARPVPVPAAARESWLASVSCSSTLACIAVGSFIDSHRRTHSLALRWTGRIWSIQRTPAATGERSSGLLGVSCPASNSCLAVGYYRSQTGSHALIERWNGDRWSIEHIARQPDETASELDDITCNATASCTAVGDFENGGPDTFALIEHWTGSSWRTQPAPRAGSVDELLGVSCTSSTACAAVGVSDIYGALTEHWDGHRWTVIPELADLMDQSAGLGSVSCTSKTACTAVGGVGNSAGEFDLIERWNGKRWSEEEFSDGTLYGVSCTSAKACVTVGTVGYLKVGQWNGSTWSMQELSHFGSLYGVSCPIPGVCMAVGYTEATSRPSKATSMLMAPASRPPPALG